MSHLHEHQIVFDHAIPPYAWHYKCAVAGCDYETDSLRAPDQSDEIARLRALLDAANDRLSEYDKVIIPGLDRLQSAEAVVEQAKRLLHYTQPENWAELRKALAAWEERHA